MIYILRTLALAYALRSEVPSASLAKAYAHATAAMAATDPITVAAIAVVESDLDVRWSAHRVAGTWTAVRCSHECGPGPWFCGPTQTKARTWAECVALRRLSAGYAAGSAELEAWRVAAGGDLVAALAAYGCGNQGLRGKCRSHARRVLRVAKRLTTSTGMLQGNHDGTL